MSKRSSNFGGDEERYGAYSNSATRTDKGMDTDEPPRQATAAQMAKRRIAQMKKPGSRPRSGSPQVPNTGASTLFGQSQPQQQQAPQAQNPFSSTNFNFSFGQPQPQNGGTAFQFGASAPILPQQNGTSSMFGQSQPAAPSFGSSFNVSSSQPQTSQPQTNGFNPSASSIFSQQPQSNNTSFGGFGQSQPATATPATATTSTFGSFGQSQSNATNGTSSFALGAVQKDKEADKPSSVFAGFNTAQQGKDKPSTSVTGSGTTPQPEKENSRASTPFAGFGAPQQEKAGGLFSGGLGPKQPIAGDAASSEQQNGNNLNSNPFAGFGQKPPEGADKPSSINAGFGQNKAGENKTPSNLFGGLGSKPQENGTKLLFTPQTGAKDNPIAQKLSGSLFSGNSSAQTNGPQPSNEGTQQSTLFNFGSSQPVKPAQEKPAENIFSKSVQPNGQTAGQGLFGAKVLSPEPSKSSGSVFDNLPKKDLSNGGEPLFSSSQAYIEEDDDEEAERTTEKPASESGPLMQKSGLWGTSTDQAAGKTGSFFAFSKPAQDANPQQEFSQQDTSMTTPGNTPQKNLFGQTSQPTTANPASEPVVAASNTPGPSRSLFDRIDKDDVAKLGRNASSDETVQTPKASFFNATAAIPSTVKPLFQQPFEAQTPQKSPPKSMFLKPGSQSSFGAPITPAPASSSSAPSLSKAPATAPPARAAPSLSDRQTSSTAPNELDQTRQKSFRELNEAFLSHLKSEQVDQDWTKIMQYYIDAVAQTRGGDISAPDTEPTTRAKPSHTPAQAVGNSASVSSSAASKPASVSGNIFSHAAKPPSSSASLTQTPKQAQINLFNKAPNTAPGNNKRVLEQDSESTRPSATEKRSKPNEQISYPKLPETASGTAKLFEAALDKSKGTDVSKPITSSAFKPSSKPMFIASSIGDEAASATETPKAAPGGFKPTFTAPSAGNTSFLSAFGSKAKAEADVERKKRKDNDYDSEEETEEQWEKRDREEQEVKRAQLAEAAKNATGFTFSGTTTAVTPKTPLFKFGPPTSISTSTTPSVPPPKTNGLFSSLVKPAAGASTSEAGKLAPPGFQASGSKSTSMNVSRATTPGITTDGDASTAAETESKEVDGEPSDEPDMTQMDDPNALHPSEIASNDVLLEIPNALTRKHYAKEGAEKPSWHPLGNGTVFVIKDKDSGRVRILCRVGVGHIVLNFAPLKGMTYSIHPKKDTIVVASFLDHIHHSPPKPDRFFITTETTDQANDLVRVLNEGIVE